ncbi:MAG TPA: hypothetical protein PKL64_03715 [Bacteroidales bacterium]|nr:hypothetical protein [Bacteroidales bacterium]
MENTKLLKIVLYIIAGLVLLNLAVSFFGRSRLRDAINEIKDAKTTINAAMKTIDQSRGRIDKVVGYLDSTRLKLQEINTEVEASNINLKTALQKTNAATSLLKEQIHNEQVRLDSLKTELDKLK